MPAACVATSVTFILLSDRKLRIHDKSEMVNTRYDTFTRWISCNLNTNKICSYSNNDSARFGENRSLWKYQDSRVIQIFQKTQVFPSLYKCRQLEHTQSEYRRVFIWMPGIRCFLIISCVWSGAIFVIIIIIILYQKVLEFNFNIFFLNHTFITLHINALLQYK